LPRVEQDQDIAGQAARLRRDHARQSAQPGNRLSVGVGQMDAKPAPAGVNDTQIVLGIRHDWPPRGTADSSTPGDSRCRVL
jgi:hypothetical protein